MRQAPRASHGSARSPGGGLDERLGAEGERLAVVTGGEVQHDGIAAVLGEDLVQQRDVADRLGHLLAGELDHPVVDPQLGQLGPARAARLRRLVLVVGEHEVRATAVDVEPGAEQPLGHRRALDVPAGPARAPRGVPRRVLARLLRLPEREVERILLAFGALDALALVHVVDASMRQRAVVRVAADAEQHVTTGLVGVPPLDERLDVGHDRRRSSPTRAARASAARARARRCPAR